MKYEKFDVNRALAGEPVILRNGSKAYVRHKEAEFKMGLPLVGIDLGRECWETWMLSGSVYTDGVYPNGKDYDYDIIGMYPKEPLTMPDSFWDMLTPEIVAIAKDADGGWYASSEKPEKLSMSWDSRVKGFTRCLSDVIHCSFFPDCDWEDSLILRPGYGA